jgi:hypothetical protein
VAPVAARDVGVVERGAGAGDAGLADLVHEPQLAMVAAVFHVKTVRALEWGEVVLLHGVGIESGGVDDAAAGVHGCEKRVLHSVLAAVGAIVHHNLIGEERVRA